MNEPPDKFPYPNRNYQPRGRYRHNRLQLKGSHHSDKNEMYCRQSTALMTFWQRIAQAMFFRRSCTAIFRKEIIESAIVGYFRLQSKPSEECRMLPL